MIKNLVTASGKGPRDGTGPHGRGAGPGGGRSDGSGLRSSDLTQILRPRNPKDGSTVRGTGLKIRRFFGRQKNKGKQFTAAQIAKLIGAREGDWFFTALMGLVEPDSQSGGRKLLYEVTKGGGAARYTTKP